MSGSLQAFFQMAPLELFRVLAVNRKRFMTQSRLYSSIKKLYKHILLAGRSIDQDLNLVQERRAGSTTPGCSPHLVLCPLRCGGHAQHRPCPACWWAELQGGGGGKLPFSPFLVSPSWRDAVPLLALPWGILSLAGISPHVAAGRLISASCGSKDFVPRITATYGG